MNTKTVGEDLSPEAELESFLGRFDPRDQELFRSVRAALRRRFPTVDELAYDYPHSVVLGYSPTARGVEAVVAIAARADGVFLYFSNGPELPDPKKLLQGSGKQVRFIRIDTVERLEHPDVKALILAAIEHATVPLPSTGKGRLVIQSSAAKRRPRKGSTKARGKK